MWKDMLNMMKQRQFSRMVFKEDLKRNGSIANNSNHARHPKGKGVKLPDDDFLYGQTRLVHDTQRYPKCSFENRLIKIRCGGTAVRLSLDNLASPSHYYDPRNRKFSMTTDKRDPPAHNQPYAYHPNSVSLDYSSDTNNPPGLISSRAPSSSTVPQELCQHSPQHLHLQDPPGF